METISDLDRAISPLILKPPAQLTTEFAEGIIEGFRQTIAEVNTGPALLDLSDVSKVDSMGVSIVVGTVKELSAKRLSCQHSLPTKLSCAYFQIMQISRLMTCYHLIAEE